MTEEDLIKEYLKSIHIHFLTPCYGGQITELTFKSYMNFGIAASQLGINYTLDTLVCESLITRGRNNLIAKGLDNKAATHFMFIDADIGFKPEAVIKLALHNVGVATGIYPLKTTPVRYNLNIIPNARRHGNLFEVGTAATGFMLIKRDIIEDLISAFPDKKYKDSVNFGAQYEPYMYALFESMVDEHGYYLSEDWTFCKRVREVLRKPIWADISIKLDHLGAFNYQGNVAELNKLVDEWSDATSVFEQNDAYIKN